MTPRRKSRSRPRRRRPAKGEFRARLRRRSARNKAREAAGWRARVGLNFFWADCPDRLCRRKQCCRSADPEDCFRYNWAGLDKNEQRFRAEFMEAFARLRDPDEAMVEAIARALMRREAESAASGTAAQ